MSPGLFAILWSIAIIAWFILVERRFGNRFRAMLVAWSGGRALRGFLATTGLYLVVCALALLITVFAIASPGGEVLAIGLWLIGTIALVPVSMFPLHWGGMITTEVLLGRIPRRVAAAINVPAFLLGLVSAMSLLAAGFALFAP
ncbi:hypothetical protein [Microbacterium halophytorum]|uniref:hypothetical protein n=1 Tax=Microbacterium halophytorum TaxID=2067568 RepID=UPI000CFC5D26|nr:hypothetical protein [Microbacterium halophytorum]